MSVKTNTARILDRFGVNYEIIEYQVDEEDLSAIHVAELLNQPISQIYKTLVLKGDKTGYLVAVIQGDAELDLKALAQISKNKRCEMLPMKELLPVTGFIRGGCSPIGMKKVFPVFFDSSIQTFDFVYISAGVRGKQLKISPVDLINITKGTLFSLQA
jgi:Cys-tRNA(Pro)/Cys-tRNA(Cys) deacylase